MSHGAWQPWLPVSVAEFPSSSTTVTLFCSPGLVTQSPACVVCVAVLTVTEHVPFAARFPKLQLSFCAPTAPVTVHVGDPPLWPLQLAVGLAGPQLRLLLGSGSVS